MKRCRVFFFCNTDCRIVVVVVVVVVTCAPVMLSEAGRPIVFLLYVYLSVCLSVCLTVCAKNEEKHMIINQCNSKLLDFGDIRP